MGDSLSYRLPDSVKYWMTPGDEQTVFNSSADGYIRDVAHLHSLVLVAVTVTVNRVHSDVEPIIHATCFVLVHYCNNHVEHNAGHRRRPFRQVVVRLTPSSHGVRGARLSRNSAQI